MNGIDDEWNSKCRKNTKGENPNKYLHLKNTLFQISTYKMADIWWIIHTCFVMRNVLPKLIKMVFEGEFKKTLAKLSKNLEITMQEIKSLKKMKRMS